MLYLLFACSKPDPVIGAVNPAQGRPGDAIEITGQHFRPELNVLVGGKTLEGKVIEDAMIRGQAPSGLAPGPHDVMLSIPGAGVVTKTGGFTVTEAPKAVVCGADQPFGAANVDARRKVVQTFRFNKGRGEEPDVVEVPWDEIAAVEFEGHALEDSYCTAVVLRATDGRRLVFEESRQQNLKDKAQHVAGVLHKPIDVVREDERAESQHGAGF